MEKNSRADRARQFMPFSALRGFEELIRQQNAVPEPRRELSEEQASVLSAKLAQVRRGMLVAVKFYDRTGYVTLRGMISEVDFSMRTLTVVKRKIPFDDLIDIGGEEIREAETL